MWLELSQDEQKSYKDAKAKIIEQMRPVQFVSIDDFHHQNLLPGKPLSMFAHELKQLMDQTQMRRYTSSCYSSVFLLLLLVIISKTHWG